MVYDNMSGVIKSDCERKSQKLCEATSNQCIVLNTLGSTDFMLNLIINYFYD